MDTKTAARHAAPDEAPYLLDTLEVRACTEDEHGIESYGVADAAADLFTVYCRVPEPDAAMPDFTPEYALSDHESREEAELAATGWRAVFTAYGTDTPVRVTMPYDAREVGGDTMHEVTADETVTVLGYVVEWFDVHVKLGSGEEVWISPNALAPVE